MVKPVSVDTMYRFRTKKGATLIKKRKKKKTFIKPTVGKMTDAVSTATATVSTASWYLEELISCGCRAVALRHTTQQTLHTTYTTHTLHSRVICTLGYQEGMFLLNIVYFLFFLIVTHGYIVYSKYISWDPAYTLSRIGTSMHTI